VNLLQELVSVAFTAATSNVEAMRPAGVVTLINIVEKFGSAFDPDYEGHLLLEQYHAQIAAALRPCFGSDVEPCLAASGCDLASRYTRILASNEDGHHVDPLAVRKLVALLTKFITDGIHKIQFPAFSEAAATMVRTSALRAMAELQQQVTLQPNGESTAPEVSMQLEPILVDLRDGWIALLRDFSFLQCFLGHSKMPYRPHIFATSCSSASRGLLLKAWAPVLDAASSIVDTGAWRQGRASAKSVMVVAHSELADELQPIAPRPVEEDFKLLLGLATCMLTNATEKSIESSEEENEECCACVRALVRLLLPEACLTQSVLPISSLNSIVVLMHRMAQKESNKLRNAVASLAFHISTQIGPWLQVVSDIEDARPLMSALQRLSVKPVLLVLPHLTDLASPATQRKLSSEDVPCVKDSILALAKLPTCMISPVERFRYSFMPVMLALQVCHSAATIGAEPPHQDNGIDVTCAPSWDEVCEVCVISVRQVVALLPSDEQLAQQLSCFWLSALETAFVLFNAIPIPKQMQMLKSMLVLLGALPDSLEAASAFVKVYGAVRSLLAGGEAAALQALQALQAFLQEPGPQAWPVSPSVIQRHLPYLLPEVAPLLVPSVAESTVKQAALKLMLLVCTISPPEGLLACFSIMVPLLVGCMWLTADGAPSSAQKELSAVAHASFSVLARRAPNEFKVVIGELSTDVRKRMETALREAAAPSRPTPGPAHVSSAPKIALKMDFTGFGKN